MAPSHPLGHRLSAGISRTSCIKGCRDVIAAGRAMNGLLAERREKRRHGDFPWFAHHEARFTGAMEEEVLSEARGSEKRVEKAAGGN
jgi:hypothetical protein